MDTHDIGEALGLLDDRIQELQASYESRSYVLVQEKALDASQVIQQLQELSRSNDQLARGFESPLWLITNSLDDLKGFGPESSPKWDDIGATISFVLTGRDILREASVA